MQYVLQYGVLDIQAMSMAFAVVRVAPLQHMSHRRPPSRISSVSNLIIVGLGAVSGCLSQVLVVQLLRSSASFQDATGGTYQVSGKQAVNKASNLVSSS